MRIRFDPNQKHQLDAIASIVDLFKGQPKKKGLFQDADLGPSGELFSQTCFANDLRLEDSRILANLHEVQARNALSLQAKLDGRNFSVEMETGTGKTYVYLRTIYELNRRYGLAKFVVVVPTVAIREGVVKAIEMTKSHLTALYDGTPCEARVFSSEKLSVVRQYASSNELQILILNIAAFNKTLNVVNRPQESLGGSRAIDLIAACRPIVIVDEPQNVEGPQAQAAIKSLNPTCTLRYSATHRRKYNLTYRLDPVRAYDLRLVKRIEVDSVVEEGDSRRPYIRLVEMKVSSRDISARIEIDKRAGASLRRAIVKTTPDDGDLVALSGGRKEYLGFEIVAIGADPDRVEFANGLRLEKGKPIGADTDVVMQTQIRETVREHLEKELVFKRYLPPGKRVKVLSLIFIDRVAHYLDKDAKIRRWFEEAFSELSTENRYRELSLPDKTIVHGGYFSKVRGRPSDTDGESESDRETYELIMREKERLLSPDEPLRFIFSHSALREGWDNPNVFQVCTLNETQSEMKKRQEIGRGMRLAVDESGERLRDNALNVLTVIANESYEDFARKLQTEIENDCGIIFDGRIMDRRDRKRISLRDGWKTNRDFLELWQHISKRAEFDLKINSAQVIAAAQEAIRKLPRMQRPKIVAKKATLELDETGTHTSLRSIRSAKPISTEAPLPDLIKRVQERTGLTRNSLIKIFLDSERLGDFVIDPERFIELASISISDALCQHIAKAVQYEKVAGVLFDIGKFQDREVDGYLPRLVKVGKSIYEYVDCDSEVEKTFARNLDANEDVPLFLKLPGWFSIDTPLGGYNPDWAIVKGPKPKLYLVRETKSDSSEGALRGNEAAKVECARRYFRAVGVDYDVITDAADL